MKTRTHVKVLHVNDHLAHVGGAETILFNTLGALARRGVENVVVHGSPPETEGPGVTAYSAAGPEGGVTGSRSIRRLGDIIEREGPDLIHLHGVDDPEVARACRRRAPTVQSVYNHNLYCPGGAKFLPLRGRVCDRAFGVGCISSALLTRCNSLRPKALLLSQRRSRRMPGSLEGVTLIAISRYQVERLLENGYPESAIKLLPPFTALPPSVGNSDGRTILFAGRVVHLKGLSYLLRALRHVNAPYRLAVNGDGPSLEGERRLARDLGLEDKVEFVGWMSGGGNLALYREAAIVVVPSVWPEPFGMVGIEAMSYGRPVVAFDVGGIPEWLEDGVNGCLVRPYDVGEMAEKITMLLEHPETASEMGRRGRERVREEFGEERHISRLLEIYREAADGRTAPRPSGAVR